MALTRDFRDTIRERAQREPAFRQSLLREGLQLIKSGDFATGRAVLRNYSYTQLSPVRKGKPMPYHLPSFQREYTRFRSRTLRHQ